MTIDGAGDRHGSVNIAENDLSRLAVVKLSAVRPITYQNDRHMTEKYENK